MRSRVSQARGNLAQIPSECRYQVSNRSGIFLLGRGRAIIPHMHTPDANVVKDRYRRLAADYDSAMSFLDRVRTASFEHLDLKPGESVLDLGCGTGISFERLHRDVGSHGRIIGVEFSPEMLEMARRRVELNGWRNVTLIEGDANTVDIPGPLDAALAFFVPEILNSPAAVRRALDSLSPGGRLVASGVRHARGPLGPLFNFYFQTRFRTWRWVGVRRVIRRMLGRGQPYAVLEAAVPNLERWDYIFGCAYVARATREDQPPHHAPPQSNA